MEPPSLLPHVDELVMEYLLFRGFTKSFQVFSAERKRDRARGFDVDQIISQLLVAVQTYQIETVLETWKFLTARFFNHLDASYASTLQQLETSLLRLYVVNAVKAGHREKAAEFFQLHADKLNASVAAQGAGSDSWCRWFILPYIEHPENDAYFQVFFSQPWLEAFVTSFRNFLSLVFRNLPLPKLLAFQLARLEEPTLKLRLKVSQSEATRLRLYNSEATTKIKKLEEAGRQLHSILRMMVQHSFMEHFSASTPSYVDGDRNKSRSRSRSYGAATASVGLSPKQMKEIGELFGISSDESPHVDPPVPLDPRDIPRQAEVYLPVDELSDDQALGQDDEEDEVDDDTMDAPALEDEAGSDPVSPMFSPIATASSPLAQNPSDGVLTGSSLTPIERPPWSTAPKKVDGNIRASLIREFNMLNDWKSTKSAMTARNRFSSDGQFLAIAKLGNSHIDIWSANPVELSPSSTIKLPARLTSLSWLGPGPSKQLLACALEDGEVMLWDSDGQEVISCPPNEDNLQVQQLMCAREAPIAACLYTSRDEEDNALQQILVLHGGMEEPMQDYFPMEDKQLTCIAWSNMGNVLITGSRTGDIEFIDVIRPERVHRCNLISCSGSARIDGGNLSAICLSPDGTSMLSVHENGSVVMEWSVAPILVAVASPIDAASDVRGSVIDVKPSLMRTYEMDKPLAPTDAKVDTTIRFLGAAELFVVADASALHIFKRGEKRAISTFFPNQATIADLDWHPKLPACCSANQDGVISLWSMKAANE
ncbi:WD repeat-containing protein 91 [Phytophthora pseudosyringae]|uniref:WD repeat-containing protein 91 n=1 Tax=Phytophthora pseudosyringae TaxID=221518 RepID=A0A8T1VR22_9STRA|nr:WD repeat-containing protein 91 [Phytophthora pseudosyringae]